MENERFELQNVAIPFEWQLPAPKCCKLQVKRTEQQLQKQFPKQKKKDNSGPLVNLDNLAFGNLYWVKRLDLIQPLSLGRQ
jgi:hypothetical protein